MFIHCTWHKMKRKFQSPSQTMLRCLIHVVNALNSSLLLNTIRPSLRWYVLAFLLNYHKCINTSSLISCANGNLLKLNSAKKNKQISLKSLNKALFTFSVVLNPYNIKQKHVVMETKHGGLTYWHLFKQFASAANCQQVTLSIQT